MKFTDHPSPVVRSIPWTHAFGSHAIDICEDGTVLIDGHAVYDTLPPPMRARADAEAASAERVVTGVLR